MIEIGTQFKASEKIPAEGKYKCIVCGLIVDIAPHFIKNEATFFTCPICLAGDEKGPKGSHEDVWEFLG